jgi:hypothetical protein
MRLGLALAAAALGAGTASAGAAARPAEQALMIRIEKNAALVDGGDAILVAARVRCAAGYAVAMSNLYVDQGAIDNDVSSLDVVCDGEWHRVTARVESYEGTFAVGEARVVPDVTVISLTSEATDTDMFLRIVHVRDQ